MVITISNYSGRECFVECTQGGKKAEEYRTRFGSGQVSKGNLFSAMEEIADFVNNELKEECMFEVM